jgi:hypothetical protein
MALQPFVWPWPLFSFLILYTIGRTPWTSDQPIATVIIVQYLRLLITYTVTDIKLQLWFTVDIDFELG